ncbi:MAG TPA: LEA type 2 family protein [Longimicrobiales bacterium]|nr:LEA type 2 family protein [Longimicrobiales bacterium]
MRAHSSSGRRRACVWLAVCLSAQSCAWAFTPPTVRVESVRLTSLTFTGGAVQVDLEVENPNRFALESEDFRYALSFAEGSGENRAWVTLAEGSASDPVRVPSRGRGSVSVMVPFDLASVGAALGRLLRSGELEYRFTGQILARTPLGSRRIPIDQQGLFRP